MGTVKIKEVPGGRVIGIPPKEKPAKPTEEKPKSEK